MPTASRAVQVERLPIDQSWTRDLPEEAGAWFARSACHAAATVRGRLGQRRSHLSRPVGLFDACAVFAGVVGKPGRRAIRAARLHRTCTCVARPVATRW